MSHNKKEILSGVIFFLIAVALYAGSYAIVVTTNDAMGPQFFPRTWLSSWDFWPWYRWREA